MFNFLAGPSGVSGNTPAHASAASSSSSTSSSASKTRKYSLSILLAVQHIRLGRHCQFYNLYTGACRNCKRIITTTGDVCESCRLLPCCRRCRRCRRRLPVGKFTTSDGLCTACHRKTTEGTRTRYALGGTVEEHELEVPPGHLDVPVLIQQNASVVRDLVDDSLQRNRYVL